MKRQFTSLAIVLSGAVAICVGTGCEKQPSRPTPPATAPATPSISTRSPATAPSTNVPQGGTSRNFGGSESSVSTPAPVKSSAVRPTTSPANIASSQPHSAPKPPEDSKVAVFGGLSAPKPVTWIWHPPANSMRMAEYSVPGREGTDQASVAVIKAGGSIEQNIERWKGQFRTSDMQEVEPKVEKFEADGMPVTVVEFAGEYSGMSTTNFTPDQLFLAAIVEAPGGQIVIRFVGPTGTVEPNRGAFMDMIHGLHRVEPQK